MEPEARGTTLADQIGRLVQNGEIAVKKTDRSRSAELTAMKADDLRVIAKGLGITGYSSMKKDALVAAIVAKEIEDGTIVGQPDLPSEGAKAPTNGNGTAHAAPANKEIKVGDELTGMVSGINFSVGGMFVTLGDKSSGLAHSNQIALEGESRRTTMARLAATFKDGDEVAVRVTRVNRNEAKGGRLEIGLELIGDSRKKFVAATVERQEADDRGATNSSGEGAGATTSETGGGADTAGIEPDHRPTTDDDLVCFRAREIEPAILFVLECNFAACVEHGLTRRFEIPKHKEPVLRLKALMDQKTEAGIRVFVEGFKHDAWTLKEFTRAQAEMLKNTFVGIALGLRAGLSRGESDHMNKLLQPFYAHKREWNCDEHCTEHATAFGLADVVKKEVEDRKAQAVTRREEAVAEMADAFNLVSAVSRPRTSPKAGSGTASTSEPEIGTIYDGKVVNVPEQGYGVFVEFGGHKGLVHVSTMPGKPSRESLEQYAPDKVVRVKLIRKTDRGYELQFQEHVSQITPEPRVIRGPFPKKGDVYLGIVNRIGKMADTVVIGIDGHTGVIYTNEIGWGLPGRMDREREEFRGRLEGVYPKGKQVPVEVVDIRTKWNNHLGKDVQTIVLRPIEPHEYARRKGGSHGQGGGGASRPATAAKPAADDKDSERATAVPAEAATAEPEERRETVEVDLDKVTGKPVECKQDPDSGICVNHSNGQPTTMMPGEVFCRIGRELIRQGGIPAEKKDEAPATDGGTAQAAVAATVTRRGDGNVPSVVINTVTFGELAKLDGEVSEDEAQMLSEIRVLVTERRLLTKAQAWEVKDKLVSLGKKYGASEWLMDRLVRRSYGTPEQVDTDQKYAEERAFRAHLKAEDRQFVCMANGGLGGHKTPWFLEAGRTNQLHPELATVLMDVVPERHHARSMATRLAKEAEDGLPLCLKCADLRLGWVADLLSEDGLTKGTALNRLQELCPANDSGRRPQVFSFINREPHSRAAEAYEKAVAEKERRVKAAQAAKDPAPSPGDDEKTASVKRAVRARSGGAFHVERDRDAVGDNGGRSESKPSAEPKPCKECTTPTLRADGVCNDCRREARKARAKAKAAPKKEKKGDNGKKKGGKKK